MSITLPTRTAADAAAWSTPPVAVRSAHQATQGALAPAEPAAAELVSAMRAAASAPAARHLWHRSRAQAAAAATLARRYGTASQQQRTDRLVARLAGDRKRCTPARPSASSPTRSRPPPCVGSCWWICAAPPAASAGSHQRSGPARTSASDSSGTHPVARITAVCEHSRTVCGLGP